MNGFEFGIVLVALVGVIVYQQFFFLKQIQVLVDKLMSRSFQEYTRTKEPLPPRVKVESDPPEDLRVLQGITA